MQTLYVVIIFFLAASQAQDVRNNRFRSDWQTFFQSGYDSLPTLPLVKENYRTNRDVEFYSYSQPKDQSDIPNPDDFRTDRQYILDSTYGTSESHRARLIARDIRTNHRAAFGFSPQKDPAVTLKQIRTDRQAIFDSSYGLKETVEDRLTFHKIKTNRESVFLNTKPEDESVTDGSFTNASLINERLTDEELSILENDFHADYFEDENHREERQAHFHTGGGNGGRYIRPGQGDHMEDGGFGLNRLRSGGAGWTNLGHRHGHNHHHRAGYRPPN